MSKKKNKTEIAIRERTYDKSNTLINARGKSSALGLKLFAIGISSIQQSSTGELSATISGQQLREIFGNKNGSFYSEIKEIIQPTDERTPSILDWRLYLNDSGKEMIEGINVITTARFENGILTLNVNPRLRKELLSLQGDYTRLSLTQMVNLKSSYSIRCYEIFKSYIDKQDARGDHGPEYTITYPYREFRQIVGLTPVAKRAGEKPEEPLPLYSSFRRQVLDKSMQEINAKTNIWMNYEPIKVAHGAVSAIRFTIRRQNNPSLKQKNTIIDISPDLTESQKNAVIGQTVILLMGSGIDAPSKDVASICSEAGYDIEKITEAIKMCSTAKNIEHPTAWIISALRNGNYGGYKKNSTRKRGTSSKKPGFNDFKQNDYDFEELEKQLLK